MRERTLQRDPRSIARYSGSTPGEGCHFESNVSGVMLVVYTSAVRRVGWADV